MIEIGCHCSLRYAGGRQIRTKNIQHEVRNASTQPPQGQKRPATSAVCKQTTTQKTLHRHNVFNGARAKPRSTGKARLWLIGIPVRAQHPAAKRSRCPRRTASQGRPPAPSRPDHAGAARPTHMATKPARHDPQTHRCRSSIHVGQSRSLACRTTPDGTWGDQKDTPSTAWRAPRTQQRQTG